MEIMKRFFYILMLLLGYVTGVMSSQPPALGFCKIVDRIWVDDNFITFGTQDKTIAISVPIENAKTLKYHTQDNSSATCYYKFSNSETIGLFIPKEVINQLKNIPITDKLQNGTHPLLAINQHSTTDLYNNTNLGNLDQADKQFKEQMNIIENDLRHLLSKEKAELQKKQLEPFSWKQKLSYLGGFTVLCACIAYCFYRFK
jgi:hypothetical protein